jgi:hypothetical protein
MELRLSVRSNSSTVTGLRHHGFLHDLFFAVLGIVTTVDLSGSLLLGLID